MKSGVQILSSAGAELLRAALEKEEKLVFTRAIAGSKYDLDRGDLAAKPVAFFNGVDGTIIGVSYAEGCTQVSCAFDGSGDGAPVKSVCICAQVAIDDPDPQYDPDDDVVFAAWSDDNSGFVDSSSFALTFDLPIALDGVVDDGGDIPSNAGLSVVSFTPGEGGADGVLQIKLSNGKIIDIAANEHT